MPITDPELIKIVEKRVFEVSISGIRVFTADANSRKFAFHIVTISEDGKANINKYAETDITQEHADLLKLSIPPS